MYIHPFDNGNGRMGRLLTYALLIKLGFNVKSGRIINPSSVFYTDRDKYYEMLGVADSMEERDILLWCDYFLSGLKHQIEKIDNLLSGQYTREQILIPMVKFALDRKHITKEEYNILMIIIKNEKMAIKSADLSVLGYKTSQQKTYVMQKMREKKIVRPLKNHSRIYTINFTSSYLLRGVIKTLKDNGFVADFLDASK
jgi:Fic family protein